MRFKCCRLKSRPKNRLKRDRPVFFIPSSGILAKYAHYKMSWGRGASLRADNLFSASASPRLASPHLGVALPEKHFLQNEAKFCPSLLRILKKRTQNEPK